MTEHQTEKTPERTIAEFVEQNGPVELGQGISITLDVLSTVGKLHDAGKIHAAISVRSILLDENMSAHLI